MRYNCELFHKKVTNFVTELLFMESNATILLLLKMVTTNFL